MSLNYKGFATSSEGSDSMESQIEKKTLINQKETLHQRFKNKYKSFVSELEPE